MRKLKIFIYESENLFNKILTDFIYAHVLTLSYLFVYRNDAEAVKVLKSWNNEILRLYSWVENSFFPFLFGVLCYSKNWEKHLLKSKLAFIAFIIIKIRLYKFYFHYQMEI